MKRGAWALVLMVGCARPGSIPGGPADRVPPIVVETRPGPMELVSEWTDPVLIRFNERISERTGSGSLNDVVVVSPELGEIRVRHKRDALEVSVLGGFPAGKVYRVTLRPQIQDLFGNTLRDPFELVFSTGPEPVPTVVAGSVVDRLTDQPKEVRVDAVQEEGGEVYPASSDRQGIFALRFLPAGRYRLRAYEDRNRNGTPDFSEPQDQTTALLRSGQDTVFYSLRVLEGDSTAARVARIEVHDSVTLDVTFDDYLDPELPLNTARVRFTPEGEATADTLPNAERFLYPFQHEALLRERAALQDTLAAAPAAVPGRVPVSPLARGPGSGEPPDQPRPSQSLVVLLDRPLPPGVPLTVELSGIVNIHRIPLGGGTGTVTREVVPDTIATPVDTLPGGDPIRLDTLQADTLRADTTMVVDTMGTEIGPLAMRRQRPRGLVPR